jgi:flagellar hook assembly protein FlgD
MVRIRHALPSILVLTTLFLFLLMGCGEDDPAVPPGDFAVIINVEDTQGNPVPGLHVGLAPETSFYQDGKSMEPAGLNEENPPLEHQLRPAYPNPFYPATTLNLILIEPAYVDLTIENIEGTTIRTLVDYSLAAGEHHVVWDGMDGDQQLARSGVYFARMTVRQAEGGEAIADMSQAMLLARLDDGDTGIGVTDGDGRLVLTDQTLFPFTYAANYPFPAHDETGEMIGTIDLTADMRFLLSEEGTNNRMRFNRDVDGSAEFTFVWDETLFENFHFTLTVVDALGGPVEGVDLIILPDTPYYMDGKITAPADRAAVRIPFETAQLCDASLSIEDLAGDSVFHFMEEDVQVGAHSWMWNGRDDAGLDVHSGVYHVRLVLYETDSQNVLYDAREPMLLAKMDFDDDNMGTTDRNGQIIIEDQRLFPHEMNAESQEARNESGEILGPIEFAGNMRFYLAKPGEGSMMRVRQVGGLRELQLVWDPRGRAEVVPAGGNEPLGAVCLQEYRDADFPPLQNRLRGPYPNPFN